MANDLTKDSLMRQMMAKFKVVMPPPRRAQTSRAEVRITAGQFVFNQITAAELGYPQYACMYISNDGHQIVITSCPKNDVAIPFSDQKNSKKKSITVCNKGLIKNIRKLMEWEDKKNYTVPAVACFDGNIILFDLDNAFIRKKGEQWKKAPDNVLDTYPKLSDFLQTFRQTALAAHNPSVIQVDDTIETTYRSIQDDEAESMAANE